MKYIITESQYGNTIDKFISHQFEPHKEKRTKKHPESIFWVKDGEVIAEIEKSDYFWVSPQIWTNIMSMFSLEAYRNSTSYKRMVGRTLQIGRINTFTKYKTEGYWVRRTLKLK
jgi:hypothetical protein